MKLLGLIVLLWSSIVSAQSVRCQDKLLPYPRPSAAHMLTPAEWRSNAADLTAAMSDEIINALVFGKLLCGQSEITMEAASYCMNVDTAYTQSMTCFAASNLGFFSLTKDADKNVHVIFQRRPRSRIRRF